MHAAAAPVPYVPCLNVPAAAGVAARLLESLQLPPPPSQLLSNCWCRLDKAREFAAQPLHLDDGSHRQRQKAAAWRLWVQAQCSWQEGDAGGKLRQQLQELAGCLEQQEEQQGGVGGAAAAGAAGAAGAGGSKGAAASAFFPAAAGAAGSPRSEQERRVQGQLAQLVGLPSAADVRGLLAGLEAADRLRLEGNAAVKAGRAAEAVQKYSEALGAAGLSPAIAAVLLSNRAAAHQHLKQRAQVRCRPRARACLALRLSLLVLS